MDESRLLFADADALGAWCNNEAADDLAGLAYWGRDVDAVAERMAPPRPLVSDDGTPCWTDLTADELDARIAELDALLAARKLRFGPAHLLQDPVPDRVGHDRGWAAPP